MVEYPPPKVLWRNLLKQCTYADLDRLRSDTLIRVALNACSAKPIDTDLEAFVREVKREIVSRAVDQKRHNSGRHKRRR